MEQEIKLCDEVETVSEFTYLGDRVSAGGGCEAAVTASTEDDHVLRALDFEVDSQRKGRPKMTWKK